MASPITTAEGVLPASNSIRLALEPMCPGESKLTVPVAATVPPVRVMVPYCSAERYVATFPVDWRRRGL